MSLHGCNQVVRKYMFVLKPTFDYDTDYETRNHIDSMNITYSFEVPHQQELATVNESPEFVSHQDVGNLRKDFFDLEAEEFII